MRSRFEDILVVVSLPSDRNPFILTQVILPVYPHHAGVAYRVDPTVVALTTRCSLSFFKSLDRGSCGVVVQRWMKQNAQRLRL